MLPADPFATGAAAPYAAAPQPALTTSPPAPTPPAADHRATRGGLTTGRGPVTGRPVGSDLIPKRSDLPIKEILGGVALLVFLGIIGLGFFPAIFGGFSNLPAINSFEQGTCYIVDGPGDFSATPCEQPHDGEVVGQQDWTESDDYPGPDELNTWADQHCQAQFLDFVGVTVEASSLDLRLLYPSIASWQEGDRRAICVVQFSVPTTGSIEGAGA